MKVNLRKANQILIALSAKTKADKTRATTTVDFDGNVPVQLVEAKTTYMNSWNTQIAAVQATYSIRELVGANSTVGVLLTRLAEAQAIETMVTRVLAENRGKLNLDLLLAKQKRYLEAQTNEYGSGQAESYFLEPQELASFEELLKLAKQNINQLKDQIFAANVNTFITLDEQTVKTLQEFGLV